MIKIISINNEYTYTITYTTSVIFSDKMYCGFFSFPSTSLHLTIFNLFPMIYLAISPYLLIVYDR